eukprot:CAMPEP_0183749514 /NCGR_PEP_ID=MMETSP0737-20130205/68324_1 /TAXON_ID=385413 /ORGANISM="Thalassiosira miniscula, Strain CCMP1093" /LENGTH=182 /DNA_ID=CAMNT_0025985271 /DNA_START=640 /DNA_END=1185 /DNA_ORIENTATION=+
MVDTETKRLLRRIPTIRSFDLSLLFDHILDESPWRCAISHLGFDVVCTTSKPSTSKSLTTLAARKTELQMRLRKYEKAKFCRQRQSDKETTISLTGDEIIGDIIQSDMALIPIAVAPHGTFGSLFQRFLYGIDAIPPPSFPMTAQMQQKQIGQHDHRKSRMPFSSEQMIFGATKIPTLLMAT